MSDEPLGEDRFGPHGDPSKCPTFYDGCNCTVETLKHNIKRADDAEAERDRYKAALDSERQHLLERCYLELYVSSHDEREHKREDCLQAARAMANRIAEIDMGIR